MTTQDVLDAIRAIDIGEQVGLLSVFCNAVTGNFVAVEGATPPTFDPHVYVCALPHTAWALGSWGKSQSDAIQGEVLAKLTSDDEVINVYGVREVVPSVISDLVPYYTYNYAYHVQAGIACKYLIVDGDKAWTSTVELSTVQGDAFTEGLLGELIAVKRFGDWYSIDATIWRLYNAYQQYTV